VGSGARSYTGLYSQTTYSPSPYSISFTHTTEKKGQVNVDASYNLPFVSPLNIEASYFPFHILFPVYSIFQLAFPIYNYLDFILFLYKTKLFLM